VCVVKEGGGADEEPDGIDGGVKEEKEREISSQHWRRKRMNAFSGLFT
jgi:hypothetical protein